jgi:hypothetical protein
VLLLAKRTEQQHCSQRVTAFNLQTVIGFKKMPSIGWALAKHVLL